MNALELVKASLRSTHHLATWFVSDLSDADLLVRPASDANHIAWQLGHLISAESSLVKTYVPGAVKVELPAGFDEQHKGPTAKSDSGFLKKADYVNLFGIVREATLATVDRLKEADLDKSVEGKMAKIAPNVGAMLNLVNNHTMMHAGQFSVVRRKLGKPVLF